MLKILFVFACHKEKKTMLCMTLIIITWITFCLRFNEWMILMCFYSIFQAINLRDALTKSIYACLFDWLVEQINKSLAVGKRNMHD